MLKLLGFIGGCKAGRHFCWNAPRHDIAPSTIMKLRAGTACEIKPAEAFIKSLVRDLSREWCNSQDCYAGDDRKYVCCVPKAKCLAYPDGLSLPYSGHVSNMNRLPAMQIDMKQMNLTSK
jgi:hypothetical protein